MIKTIQLEKKLKKERVSERAKMLLGVYKQLAFSHKGKRANGEYRDALDSDPLNAPLLVHYVVNQLEKYGLREHAYRLFCQNGCPIDPKRIDSANIKTSLKDIGPDFDRKTGYTILAKETRYLSELIIPFITTPTKEEVIAIAQALGNFVDNRTTRRQELQYGPNQWNIPKLDIWSVLIDEAQTSPRALCGSSYAVCGKGSLAAEEFANSVYVHGIWPGLFQRAAHPKETLENFASTIKGE